MKKEAAKLTLMFELWCGKINEANYQRDKDLYSSGLHGLWPYDVLSDRFEFRGPYWLDVVREAESFFGNMTWIDTGSFFCRGNYEQMKSFLEWGKADEKAMSAFRSLPVEGDYGFLFIEDY